MNKQNLPKRERDKFGSQVVTLILVKKMCFREMIITKKKKNNNNHSGHISSAQWPRVASVYVHVFLCKHGRVTVKGH